LKARLVGIIEAEQTEKNGKRTRNDRLVGMAVEKESPTSLEQLDLDEKTLKEIEFFFVSYNKLEGKKFKVLGKGGPKKAMAQFRKCVK
jgi:inorganic pyrophosphatase